MQERIIRDAWGDWTYSLPWDHYCTFTYRRSVSPAYAYRDVARWARHLDRVTRQGVSYFAMVEYTTRGWVHLHVLTYGTDGLAVKDMKAAWERWDRPISTWDPATVNPNRGERRGRCSIEAYHPDEWGAYYVTKHAGKPDAEPVFVAKRGHPLHRNAA